MNAPTITPSTVLSNPFTVGGFKAPTPAPAPVASPAAAVAKPPVVTPVAVPPPTPITAVNSSHTAPTSAPVPVPTTPAPTAAHNALGASLAGFGAGLQGQADAAAKATDPANAAAGAAGAPDAGKSLKDILSGILTLNNKIATKGDETNRINSEAGIDAKTQKVQKLTNDYNARSRYYDNLITQAQTVNPEGKSADAIQQNVDQLTRQKNSELADLAIQHSAATGDLSTATTLAKQKIDAEFEPLQAQIDNLKSYYSLASNDLTESEKLTAEAAIKQKQDTLDEAKQKRLISYKASIDHQYSSSNVNVSNPQYAGVVSTILGSGKFTKEQSAQIASAINGGENPLSVVRNQAKNIMGQTEATSVTKYESAATAMNTLQAALAEYYAKGGKTGVFSGNYEKVINNLGAVNNPELVDLSTQIASQLQVYRNAVSGTAYSVQEGKEIGTVFPGINKSEGLNQSIISGRLKSFDSTINGTYEATLGKSTYQGVVAASGGKAGADSKSYVESVLSKAGVSYDQVLAAVPTGQIAVINNYTGEVGHILPGEYNSTVYTKL